MADLIGKLIPRDEDIPTPVPSLREKIDKGIETDVRVMDKVNRIRSRTSKKSKYTREEIDQAIKARAGAEEAAKNGFESEEEKQAYIELQTLREIKKQRQANKEQEKENEILYPEIKVGDVIVFPSYVFHRSTSISKGTKYSAAMWCLGPPFK